MSEIDVSIIVPVYNCEEYIDRCLESLVGQTLDRIEIICVDDGSTDGSAEKLSEWAKKDGRVVVVTKENAGVSAARNTALATARGEYIMCVDSDDWLDTAACEKAMNAAATTGADVIMFPYLREGENKTEKKVIFEESRLFDREESKKLHRRFVGLYKDELQFPEKADALCTVWGKLYKSGIIKDNGIGFVDLKEIGTYEDGVFNLSYFEYVEKAYFLNECLYHYWRSNSDSITSKYKPKLGEQWQKLFGMLEEYISTRNLGEEYRSALSNRISLSALGIGLNIMAANESGSGKIKLIKEYLSGKTYRDAAKTLELKYFPLKWKVFFGMAKNRFALGVYLLLAVINKARKY